MHHDKKKKKKKNCAHSPELARHTSNMIHPSLCHPPSSPRLKPRLNPINIKSHTYASRFHTVCITSMNGCSEVSGECNTQSAFVTINFRQKVSIHLIA